MNEEKMDELLRLMRAVVPDFSDMSDAGKVGFVYKFDYDPSESYEILDVVKYGMSLWTPKVDTIGNPPPDQSQEGQENVQENEYWMLFLPGALGSDYVKKTDIARAPSETDDGKPGIVMPDGKSIQIDENGLLTGTPVDFVGTLKELQQEIQAGNIEDGMNLFVDDPDNEGGEPDPDHPNNMLIKLDDYLSKFSSNAVKNWVITNALNRLEQLENETRALRATLETFGMSKICPVDVTDVTEANGMVLGAFEKNASMEGTLANEIEKVKGNFSLGFEYKPIAFSNGVGIMEVEHVPIQRLCLAQICGGEEYETIISICNPSGARLVLYLNKKINATIAVSAIYAYEME